MTAEMNELMGGIADGAHGASRRHTGIHVLCVCDCPFESCPPHECRGVDPEDRGLCGVHSHTLADLAGSYRAGDTVKIDETDWVAALPGGGGGSSVTAEDPIRVDVADTEFRLVGYADVKPGKRPRISTMGVPLEDDVALYIRVTK